MKPLILVAILGSATTLLAADPNDGGLVRTWAAHLGEGQPDAAQFQYQEGARYYESGRYAEAVAHFRQAAVADPDTPHLAASMIHAEHEAEREEAARLGAEKEKEFERWLAEGKENLKEQHFKEAQAAFEKALTINPANAEAQSLLAQAKDEPVAIRLEGEKQRPHSNNEKPPVPAQDPAAAQRHYQAGLVDYAKHDLASARKEWILTARLDSHHPKVFQAINRVDEELALGGNSGK